MQKDWEIYALKKCTIYSLALSMFLADFSISVRADLQLPFPIVSERSWIFLDGYWNEAEEVMEPFKIKVVELLGVIQCQKQTRYAIVTCRKLRTVLYREPVLSIALWVETLFLLSHLQDIKNILMEIVSNFFREPTDKTDTLLLKGPL